MASAKPILRTCISCRSKKEKKELIRIVKTPDGIIKCDGSFKADGRGAYVCKNSECILKLKKSGALSRALSSAVPEEIYEELSKRVNEDE